MTTKNATWEVQTQSLPEADPTEMLAVAERADLALLMMVSCAAVATLALATASALFA
jgi:hypothetical protein